MDPRTFAVTWDYRCPFARNAHEHVLTGLAGGADWDVTFVPFSLSQAKVAADEVDVWDEPDKDSGLLALQVGVAVRDTWSDAFPRVHDALFAARHDHGRDLRRPDVLHAVLTEQDLDAGAVFDEVHSGCPLETIRKEHERSVAEWDVWGVPTFIGSGSAVFVRLMERPDGDADVARRTVERVVDLLAWHDLNEFKHTTISR